MNAHVAYNIDVPGRSLQVPQLFKKSGIDYLFVSRMKEGFYNWYSPDGSSIFTYSPGNYGWYHYHHKVLEEEAVTAMHELHKILKNWTKHGITPYIPIMVGGGKTVILPIVFSVLLWKQEMKLGRNYLTRP